MDSRKRALAAWAAKELTSIGFADKAELILQSVSGDASFRRYFRAQVNGQSFIAVDAPPDREDSSPFVAIAKHWARGGIAVPQVIASDLTLGFMLLSDFGDELLLPHLAPESVDSLYEKACAALVDIQQLESPLDYPLPAYDADKLRSEMQLCPDWFLTKLLGLALTDDELQLLDHVFEALIARALSQPQVCVHRDFHSRNLMLLDDDSLGVIDFQDACVGPVTYDLVSLVRDCYISWSKAKEQQFIEAYLANARAKGFSLTASDADFHQDFEWMGLQRHIKCVGIFSRLCLRDGKAAYLQDIPRTFAYLKDVCSRYSEFAEFHQWLVDKVIPVMEAHEQLPSLTTLEVTA